MRERLRAYIRAKGITEYRFLKEAKLSLTFFTSNALGVRARTLVKIGEAFPDLNIDWVTTGDGAMLRSSGDTVSLAEHLRVIRRKDEEIARLRGQLQEAKGRR
nr:MAG TPA: repressor regulating protein [Caudoviricetes sp.]